MEQFGPLTFGDRIKFALRRVDKSQAWLAREMSKTPACVTYWVQNKRSSLSTETIGRIADLTGVRPEWLAFGTGGMMRESRQ